MKIVSRIFSLTLVLFLLFSFAGCTVLESVIPEDETYVVDDYPEPEIEEFSDYENLDYSKYLVFPDYSKLSLTIEIVEVTDEDVEDTMSDLLSSFNTSSGSMYYQHLTEDSEGNPLVLKEKDYVFYHSSAKLDGNDVPSLTRTYADVVLEDDEDQLTGFWNAFIGKSVGSTFSFDLTFPEDYYSAESNPQNAELLNGKTVTWTITVQYVAGDKEKPTVFTDAIAEEFYGCDTVEILRAKVKQALVDDEEEEAIYNARTDVWTLVSDATVVLMYPENSVEYYNAELLHELAEYADQYSVTIEKAMTSQGFKDADAVLEYAKEVVKEYMLLYGIVKVEGLDVTSGFEEWLEVAAEDLGTSVSTLVNYYGSYYGSDYLSMVYSTEVIDNFLLEKVNTTREYVQAQGEDVP